MKKKDKPSGTTNKDSARNDALNRPGQEKEKKLPGDYPPQEDIMNRRDTERVGLDVENFSRALGHENMNKSDEPVVTGRNEILDPPETLGNVDDLEKSPAQEMEKPVPKDLKLDEDDKGVGLDEDDMAFASNNESDVTKEDLEAIGPKDLSMNMGEDETLLKNRVWPVDMAGEDLDVPGSEGAGDVSDEAIGPEDEENDFYSLGGDRHEDQMEGK